jgi:cytochrome c553
VFVVPAWLFPIPPPSTPPSSATLQDSTPLHVPGSEVSYTLAQTRDLFAVPDWFPAEHAPMPAAVEFGRKPDAYACGFCHLPDGRGRPENASVAGLPAEYILRQVRDYAGHVRRSAWTDPPYKPTALMLQVAEAVTDAELEAAAAYFAAQPLRQRRAEVIEADSIPSMRSAAWLYVADVGGGEEPLGERIVETPLDFHRHELRDPNTPYVAYVPKGSLERGHAIATTARGDVQACVSCHGPDLRGAGPIPPLAGRSPTYLMRQLVAFRTGARGGDASAPMQPVVSMLEIGDMIAVAAYAGSLPP